MALDFKPENIWHFVVGLLIILFAAALISVNLSIIREGVLVGLNFNIFQAFYPKNIVTTLEVFFVLIFVVTALLSSIVFSNKKTSPGAKISRKDKKKYSRWAKLREVKKVAKRIDLREPKYKHAGIPLYSTGKIAYVDDGDSHSLIVGSTGSGKTQSFVLPLINILAKHDESMIITDPKGELYQLAANMLRAKGYNVIVVNLRDPQKGSRWNPLHIPYQLYKGGNPDKAIELIEDLSVNVLHEATTTGGAKDPFWEKGAAGYFVGLTLALFEDAKPSEINLNSINVMSTMGSEPLGDRQYIDEYFAMKDPNSPAYINAAAVLTASDTTRSGLLSVFKQKIKLFSTKESLSRMMAKSDIDMARIGIEKTAVFLVIHDEKRTYHPLATVFIKQCYETLIDVAQAYGGKLPIRTNFILDEFANMPPLTDATSMITAARSRNIRFNMIVQNYMQLNAIYGKEGAETIKSNSKNLVYMMTKEIESLEEISKLCGTAIDKEGKEKPLITLDQLTKLKMGEVIIKRDRLNPFKTKFPPFYEYQFGEPKYPTAEFIERVDDEPYEVFNLKEFLMNKKRQSLYELLADDNIFADEEDDERAKQIDRKEYMNMEKRRIIKRRKKKPEEIDKENNDKLGI